MTVRTIIGDCRTILPTLPPNSVQCVVTSPPYYGLRDYGTAVWDGGDAGCDHAKDCSLGIVSSTLEGGKATTNHQREASYRATCGKCGARRIDSQIGLEPTPEAYLRTMVEVFREVRRVLRDDGTCWVNMGDSYNNRTKVRASSHQPSLNNFVDDNWAERAAKGGVRISINDGVVKEKDLLMMPARLALALQADGWWLRSDIIWAKPNPMPESVTDRPTSAHEHVFLLTKRARYFFDADAVREDGAGRIDLGVMKYGARLGGDTGWHSDGGVKPEVNGRSCRNVWTIATHAFSAAHFATFPPALVERCIRAGTSERGCCAACGKPWVRQTASDFVKLADRRPSRKAAQDGANMADINSHNVMGYNSVTTTGWAPQCQCEAGDPVPCTILDPFSGAGTSLLVADRLQRNAIGIELNPAYTQMATSRIVDDAPLLNTMWPPADDPADERMAFEAQQRDLFMAAD